MKKIAMFLALLSAPLCADNYVSVGIGPYIMMPNVGIGYIQDTELGEIDYNYNFSYTGSYFVSEAKVSYRFSFDEIYFGPSLYVNTQKAKYYKGETNFGYGVVVGKNFEGYFVDMSVQKDFKPSYYKGDVLNVKLRYGVRY